MKLSVLLAGVLGASVASAAGIWWVDDDNYGKSGMTGSEAAAFGTIQEAVNAAADGDTVYVRPGTYDQGTTNDGYMDSRVVIKGKAIRLESTGDKNDTFIVGRHCTGTQPHKPEAADNDAIRCIYANYPGTEIRGFTLKNGDVKGDEPSALGSGSGLCADGNTSIRLIDCNVVDCWGTRGSGMLNGTAIRCVFAGTRTYSTAGAMGSTCRNSVLYNCIFVSGYFNGTDGFDNCRTVNCTFFGNNWGNLNGTGGYMINCVAVNNTSGSATHNPDCDGGNVLDLRYSVFGVNHNELKPKNANGLEGVIADAPVRQFLAPALGDFRPLAGTAAAANGSAAVLAEYVVTGELKSYIPAEERFLDINKQPIPTEGRIAAGACQEVIAQPNCGALTFNVSPKVTSAWGVIKVFGTKVIVSDFYAYPETYPAQIHLPREMFCDVANGIEQLYAYRLGADQWANFRPPEMDDSFWAMPDPNPANDLHVSGVWASGAFWVDPANGNDTDNDGSAEQPFKTLKKAIAEVPENGGTRWVIYAAEGLYDAANEGDAVVAASHNNRVAVTSDLKWIRFKGAGRDKSVIKGAVHEGGQYGGCGPTAARCFYAKNYCVLQGFTLQDGFAGWDGTTDNKDLSRAGSAFLAASQPIVADCRIKNCAAERGGGGINGCWYRCKFEDCYGHNGGMRTVSVWSSCSFVNCPATNLGGFLYADTSIIGVCHCSILGDGTAYSAYGGGRATWNCVVMNGAGFEARRTSGGQLEYVMDGNIACNFSGAITATGRISREDPLFASSTDLRPLAGSAAFTAGARPDSPALGTAYSSYVTTDVDGNPLKFNDKGVPVAGCHQIDGLNGVRVETPAFGTITPSGTQVLEPGASVTVTYTPAADRPFGGLEVNGELLAGATTYTFTAPAVGEAPKSAVVKAAGLNDWYVNANAATYGGDGFTPATAKKRLCDIMACNIQKGDVVHAAPGDYNEGTMNGLSGADCPTVSRVEIKDGVTLVADEGPEVTFIRGKRGSGCTAAGYGGTDPVRCVYLQNAATVKGFTIVDGSAAAPSESDQGVKNVGGGVFANSKSGIVYGCVVTNCAAVRAGGVYSGTVCNSRVVMNYCKSGTSWGSAGVSSYLMGSYIGPQGNDGSSYRDPERMEGCTFDASVCSYAVAGRTIRNCVFRKVTGGLAADSLKGCVMDAVSTTYLTTKGCSFDDACVKDADLKLDAAGRPQKDSPVIGAGDNSIVTATYGGLDAAGNPRISNVTVDAGAYEYDWRPDFSAALGTGVTVETASAAVTLENGKVKLLNNGQISGTWPAQYAPSKTTYELTAETSGEGQLCGELVSGDGAIDEEIMLVTGASETRLFKKPGADLDFAFTFVQGGAGYLSAFTQTPPPGMMLFIR